MLQSTTLSLLFLLILAPSFSFAEFRSKNSLARNVSIIGTDDRQYVPRGRGSKFSPVGGIMNRTLGQGDKVQSGTAWLIDDCHILTAAHVVTGIRSSPKTIPTGGTPRRPLEPVDIAFVAGQSSDGTFEAITGAEVVTMGDFDPEFPNLEEDWALLRIKDCLGAKDKYDHFTVVGLDVERAAQLRGRVIGAGFPADRDYKKGLTIDPSCSVHGLTAHHYSTDVWGIDCAIVGGDSGGPLLAEGRGGRLAAIAIKIADRSSGQDFLKEYTVERANIALSLRYILPKIRPFFPKNESIGQQ